MRLIDASIYLDHNATTFLSNGQDFITQALYLKGNASSVHAEGRRTRQMIEEARQKIAYYFGVASSSIVFTSGATEANNLALKGFEGKVFISAVEHDSVYKCRPDAFIGPVDEEGILLIDPLEQWLKQTNGPKLVSVMAANNETGVIQPLWQISSMVKNYGAFIHCDAVQAIQKTPLDWPTLNLDMISLSGHKIGALPGIGALIITKPDLFLKAQLIGGGQERSLRAGTENVWGILSLKKALEDEPYSKWASTSILRDYVEEKLTDIEKEIMIFGKKAPRLPNTTALTMPGVSSALQVMNFDLKGICVSAGSACSSGKVQSSRVLQAMGVAKAQRDCALRLSLAPSTTQVELDYFIANWAEFYHRLSKPLSFKRKK